MVFSRGLLEITEGCMYAGSGPAGEHRHSKLLLIVNKAVQFTVRNRIVTCISNCK